MTPAQINFAILFGIQMGARLERAGLVNDKMVNRHHDEVMIAMIYAMNSVFQSVGDKAIRDVHIATHIMELVEQNSDAINGN